MAKSIRKFIRTEKARIRREGFDEAGRKDFIEKLYKRFSKNHENKGNI